MSEISESEHNDSVRSLSPVKFNVKPKRKIGESQKKAGLENLKKARQAKIQKNKEKKEEPIKEEIKEEPIKKTTGFDWDKFFKNNDDDDDVKHKYIRKAKKDELLNNMYYMLQNTHKRVNKMYERKKFKDNLKNKNPQEKIEDKKDSQTVTDVYSKLMMSINKTKY
jgi:hypothetical protein